MTARRKSAPTAAAVGARGKTGNETRRQRSTSLPDPPYPADTAARGFNFTLDYRRVVQSDTWALAGLPLQPALLMLWFQAWQQIPAGAFVDDDKAIAARIGMPLARFQRHRATLLRGWYSANDGRLYHPVISAVVLERVTWLANEAERIKNWRAAHPVRRTYKGRTADVQRINDAGAGAGAEPTKAITSQPTTGVGVPEKRAAAAKSVSLRQRRNRG